MKAFNNIIVYSLLLTSVSCGQFQTHRDYLSEMESDDSSFFNPRKDFAVVSGDTGRDWESASERRQRTPASTNESHERNGAQYLKQELRVLEGKQSESAMNQYEKHKAQLATTSERIYFLKLSQYDRKDYLASRGFLKDEKKSYPPHEEMFALRQSNVITGMTKTDVMNNWGRPARVEVAGNPSFENEKWTYNVHGASKYIYFESGRVQGWE